MIGTTLLNRYRIDAELGEGGMGIVYQGHDTLLHRDVAIKVLSKGSRSGLNTEGRARLLHEARSAAQLNHPNIVSIYDAGEAELPDSNGGQTARLTFIVMELMTGQSLFERLPVAAEEILPIARQVCAALEHAHSHGIIHRDLKPENILLAPDGSVKLTDFGLARSTASRMSGDGKIVGTVFYLAPEAALGRPVDGRTDLYSLGVILYEMAAGQLPFTAEDPLAVISQHLYAPLVPPRAHRPEVPLALNDLIVQLLSKQPEDRPESAAEVGRVLEILENLGKVDQAEGAGKTELPVLDRLVRGRLIGRDRELEELNAAWQSAASGDGHVVLVSGEPGIGKTRLVRELVARAAVSGGRTLVGSLYAEGGLPYAPFPEILQDVLPADPSAAKLPEYVLADLLALSPDLRSRFPLIQPAGAQEPQSEQQRIFESVLAWLSGLSLQAPVLLFVDDIHWADSGALFLLRHLARRAHKLRLLIVLTYREVEINEASPLQSVLSDLNRERLADRIKLTRLDREQTGALLATILTPMGEIDASLVDAIYRETEGNPFFVEEVTKALIEDGRLCYGEVCWTAPGSSSDIEIPQSVRQTVQARLARLPAEAQEVLRMAAVLGREFDFEVLKEASDLDEEALIEALESAERAQIISELPRRRTSSSPAFSFEHALVPSSLRDGLSSLRRQRLHRRAAMAIEAVHPERNGKALDYENLGYHYEQAGDTARAGQYYTKAGERALSVFASMEAERYFRAALEMKSDPTTEASGEAERIHLLACLGEAIFRQSQYLKALETWKEAIQLCLPSGDLEMAARLYARSARAAWYAGDAARGLELCREGMAAIQAGESSPDSPGRATLLHETARALRFNDLYDEALPLCRQALEMARRLGLVEIEAEALATLGILPNLPPQEAQEALRQAIALAETAGLLSSAARAHLNLSGHLEMVGKLSESLDHGQKARELAHRMGIIDWEFTFVNSATDTIIGISELDKAEANLPELYQLAARQPDPAKAMAMVKITEALLWHSQGKFREAIENIRACLAEVRERGDAHMARGLQTELSFELMQFGDLEAASRELEDVVRFGEEDTPLDKINPFLLLSVVRARQGRLDEARPLLEKGREYFLDKSFPIIEHIVLWSEGCLAAAEGRREESRAAFEQAIQKAVECEMPWRSGVILLDWGKVETQNDPELAATLFRRALEVFERIHSPGYAERARAALSALEALKSP